MEKLIKGFYLVLGASQSLNWLLLTWVNKDQTIENWIEIIGYPGHGNTVTHFTEVCSW